MGKQPETDNKTEKQCAEKCAEAVKPGKDLANMEVLDEQNLAEHTKHRIIGKSEVVFTVKGYKIGDDFDKLAEKIRAIKMDGLVWRESHEIIPIGYGMNMLQMAMIIVDDLVSTEELFEIIGGWDEVQSVDITEFTKA